MNDITKARHFLKTSGSDLQHLESFALMLATAESRYKEIKRKLNTQAIPIQTELPFPTALHAKEVEVSLEYAVLRYLKKHNQLPKNAARAFSHGITLSAKQELAKEWIKA